MPTPSRWMVRAALLWLGLGFTVGGLLLFNKGVPVLPWLWAFRLPHVHMLLIGWMVQLAFGVAYWILPRLGGGSRGREGLAWVAYGALNTGVALAAAHDPLLTLGNPSLAAPLAALAALLYLVALAAYMRLLWPRVIPLPAFSEADLAALRRRAEEPPPH